MAITRTNRPTRTIIGRRREKRIFTPTEDNIKESSILANSQINRGDEIEEELTPSKLKNVFDEAADGHLYKIFETYKKIVAYDTRIGGIVAKRKNAPSRYAWKLEAEDATDPRTEEILKDLRKVFKKYKMKRLIKSSSEGILYGAKFFLNNWVQEDGKIIPLEPTPIAHARVEMNNSSQIPELPFGKLIITNGDKYWSAEDLQEKAQVFGVVPSDDDGFYDIAGVLRPVLKMFIVKYYAIKNWIQYSEIHGYPVSTVSLPRNQYKMFKKDVEKFLTNIGKSRYGVLFEGWEYKIQNAANGNVDIFEKLIGLTNTECEVAILGQSATTSMSGGGYSAVTTYKEDEIDNTIDDCEIIAESITDGIVKPYIQFNYPDYDYTNINFAIEVPKKKNFQDVLKKYESAGRLNLKVSKKKFQEEMDILIVEEGEDSLELEFEKKGLDASKEPEKRKETRKDGGKIADK